MITIQTNPARRAFPLLSIAGLAVGLLLTGGLGRLVDLGEWWFLVAGGVALLCFAGLDLGVGALYRPFAYDPATGTARIGRRTVPIASIREAWRTVSAGGNGAAYLVYRFRSTEGPTVRVLVAGRPLPGLDHAGRAALAGFLELAPIAGSDELGPEQLASNVVADGKKVSASAAALRAELGEVVIGGAASVAPATAPAAAVPPVAAEPVDDELLAAMLADEESAVAALRPLAGLLRARQIAWVAFVVAFLGMAVGAVGVIIASAVGVDVDVPGTGIGVAIVLGAVAVTGLAWSILADMAVRGVRAAGMRWFDAADRDTRGRGLPATFASAWLLFAPGHRVLTIAAFTAGVIGLGAMIGGPVAMTMDEVGIGLVVLLVGLVFGALAIWFWVRHRRRRREDAVWVVEKLGPRAGVMGGA